MRHDFFFKKNYSSLYSPTTPVKPRMLPVIKSQVASGRAEQSGRHGRPVPSQLPSPSASYKQATMLPSSSSSKDGLSRTTTTSLSSPNNNNKQINNKQTTQQQQLSNINSANTTSNSTSSTTSMLPLPSPNNNNNLAALNSASKSSYHQNVGITNGAGSVGTAGYSDNTMTRWVKIERHSSRLRPLSTSFFILFFTTTNP